MVGPLCLPRKSANEPCWWTQWPVEKGEAWDVVRGAAIAVLGTASGRCRGPAMTSRFVAKVAKVRLLPLPLHPPKGKAWVRWCSWGAA